jgi:hypothetical protein
VQEAAKIIITQKTQRQPSELVVTLQGWGCQRATSQTDGRGINSQTADNGPENRIREYGRGKHASGGSPVQKVPRVGEDARAVGEGRESEKNRI